MRLATSLYLVASKFSIVPVLVQWFASVLWPVLTIRTACQVLRRKFDSCPIDSAHDLTL